MTTPIAPRYFTFLAATSLALSICTSRGAVLPISDTTYNGSFTAGTPENITGNATVAGLTTTEGTFTGLLGATANAVSTGQVTSSVGTVPTDANAAATGLTANDGVNNLNSGNFQLATGTTFNSNLRLFIIESTPTTSTAGDPTTVTLINASNAQVGTYTLTIAAASFTNTAVNTTNTALATLTYTSAVAALQGVQSKLGGVTFSLADFTGTGDLSTVTGFALTSGTLDPNVVGAFAVVPEPGTLCLSGLGLALLSFGLRRRMCKP